MNSCKYIINGKSYNESQVEKIVTSNLGLLSIKTRSVEETIEQIKSNTMDRFVNIDLFTPYQEISYTRMITSFVIDKLGVLKPGEAIKVSPTAVFLQAKSLFENSKNKFDYLASVITTQEKLDSYKANPEVLKVYPELSTIDEVSQISEIGDQFKHVLENFDKFREQVQVRLRKYGLSIKADQLIETAADSEEYYRSLIQSGEAEETEISDREIQEGFEDGNVFRINPRDTASTRVKLLFSSIPSTNRNIFGIREFVDYDTIIEDFLRTGSELETVDYENLIKALLSKATYRPYLKNVVAKLSQLKAENNTQLINEILTFVNKAYQEQTLVLWNNKSGVVETKVIKSNRNSVIRQITSDWLEQQKSSDIVVKDDNKELMINTQKVKELKESLNLVRLPGAGADLKKNWVKEFLGAVGIVFTDPMIEDLSIRASRGFFREQQRNSTFDQLFEDGNFFAHVLDTYLKTPTGTTESRYDDINNGMKDQAGRFAKLAEIYYDHSADRYQTGNHQNGEGKSIYAYIQPSYLENVKRKIKSSAAYLDKILGRSFSRSSEVAAKLKNFIGLPTKDFTFEFNYMDSLKKDRKNQDGVVRKNMSNKEQIFDALLKHQNAGQRTGSYNLFTLSDKTTTPVITLSKYIINDNKLNRAGKDLVFTTKVGADFKDAFNFKQDFKNELYRLAESEINRISDYVNTEDKNAIDIKNFDKAYKFFYLFPILNGSTNAELNTVKEKLFAGETLSEEDKMIIKEVLALSFKSSMETTFNNWVSNGVIVPEFNKETNELSGYTFPFFDGMYMAQKELNGLTSFEKAVYAVADLKFNYLRAQVNALQLLGADPALFFKMPKTGVDKSKSFEQYTDTEKLNIVLSTMDEFSKRAAMFIAPGSQGVWTWNDQNGNPVDKTNYNTITLADFVRDTELFKDINVTDAQEFITVQEHIDRMMSEGKIPADIWQSITDKITKNPGGDYKLSGRELELIVQPTKPVYTENTDLGTFPRIDYVKSSTYILIPEVLAGTELNKLRKFMETENIQSAAFESAKKTGQAKEVTKVFDEHGNFTAPEKFTVQVLDRSGLHTQQEIPYQKDHITNVSQMNRTLFDGLLDVRNFTLKVDAGRNYKGKEFKRLKENVRVAQFEKAKNNFLKKFAIEQQGGKFVFTDKNKLVEMLREEALSRNFSINDINAIKLGEDGELVMPVYLMARGEKFEGLLNSIINKNIMLKNPGTSLVQVSAVATKLSFSEISSQLKSEIVWTSSYDPEKGLQYMRKGKGEVKPAQVIISQFIKDKSGKLIDLSKFVIEEDGLKMLDTSRLSADILNLVGSRIPNQGHPSMLPIEVVGFLPAYMESTVIVPDGITSQMGSDFDVDKLYAYTSELEYAYDRDGSLDAIRNLSYDLNYDGSHQSLMDLSDEELNQLYRDIHWEVLTHPATFDKITKSIDFNDVKNEVDLLDSIGFYETDPNIMPFDFERQIQVFNDNKGGKVGVGIFASLGSFLADNQDKDIFLGRVVEEDGKNITVKDPVTILSKDGRELELYKVTQQGQIGKGAALRTKGDNNSIIMTESVDNAKNKNMYRFNWHPKVLGAVQGFLSLSTDQGEIHDVTFVTRLFPQQVLKEYVELIENAQDSLSQYQDDVKGSINKKLIDKYFNLMSEKAQAEYLDLVDRAAKNEDIKVQEVFSAERLLNLLKTSVKIKNNEPLSQDVLDDYYKAQLDVLSLYNRLDEIGGELSTVIGASYIYTKGIGANIFSVTDNIRKLGKLASSNVFIGLEQLAGEVSTAGGVVSLDPVGEIGYSIQNSLFFAKNLYRDLFPVHFSPWFNKTVDTVMNNAGINKEKMGSERFIKMHKKIFNGVRAFMFSTPDLQIFDNVNEERARLLMDTPENNSLAKRITEARVKHPELLDNYFVKRLNARISTKQGDPSLVSYKSPFSDDIDELANNRGFLELILSGKEDLIEIAKDLVKYTYVTGNNETSGSFSKFIPVEYLLTDADFLNGIGALEQTLSGNGNKFIRQFMQNNPDMARTIREDEFADILKVSANQENITIPKAEKVYERLLVNTTFEERKLTGESSKLPDYLTFFDYKNDRTLLYVKMGALESNSYQRINTLGTAKSGFVEYSTEDEKLNSVVFNNLTNAQKLEKVLTNPDNVFHGSKLDLTSRIREIAMADVSTKFIGKKVPGGTDKKSYIDIVGELWDQSGKNNTNYSGSDTVMIIGTNAYTTKPDNTYITATEIQEWFNKEYKPLIDQAIAQGASFTVGAFSGMDEVVKKYLKSQRYWETNSGLGYSLFTSREAENNINIDSLTLEDFDYDSINFDDLQEPGFDNIDLEAMSLQELPKPDRVQGEEISSYSDNLGFALTNPVFTSPTGMPWSRNWTAGQNQWREYMKDGIEFKGVRYKDVEEAYQKNKKSYNAGANLLGLPTTDDLMIELIEIKLNTYPKLVEGIDAKGGLPYLLSSTHQPTKKNSHWETGGDNAFITALAKAYQNVKNADNISSKIYTQLGDKTASGNVVIKSVYQKAGVEYAKSIGGVFSLRLDNSDKHFGNPFSNHTDLVKKDKLIQTSSTKESVERYIDWVINSKEPRAEWIRTQLSTGTLKGKPIVYYKELGEPSHATALDYLINRYKWESEEIDTDVPANLAVEQDPDVDLFDLIDPNDLINMDTDDTEVDLDNLRQAPEVKQPVKVNVVDQLIPMELGSASVSDVLDNIYSNTTNPFYKNLIDIFKSRKTGVPNVDVFIDNTTDNPGMFKNNQIIINSKLALSDNPELSEQTNLENVLMHEITHAYTVNLINDYLKNKNNLSDRELIFVKSLDNLFKDVKEKLLNDSTHSENLSRVLYLVDQQDADVALTPKDKSLYYGLTNLHEFSAMMLTDPGFQQFMNSIQYQDKSNKSVFEQFKELLTKLFASLAKALNMQVENNSALAQGVGDIVSMINSSEQMELFNPQEIVPDSLPNEDVFDLEDIITEPAVLEKFDPYKIKTPKGLFDANDDQKVAIDKVSEFFNRPVTKNFDDNIFLLFGAGGTGKTAVSSNAINKALKEQSGKRTPTVGFAAVTHTAKGELRNAGNDEAKTLASMLGALPKFENGVETYELVPYDEYLENDKPLPMIFSVDWLVIDEASMLGEAEKSMIQQRIAERGSPLKILFMGDHAQIPPVGEKPDQDGFAIDLRKDSNKSVSLVKIERTKNVDISDLGIAYRRAVDYYNTKIEFTGSSARTDLPVNQIVPVEKTVSSANVMFTSNKKDFVNKFIEIFKKDPLNPRNAIIIAYNNELHSTVLEVTAYIRKSLLGAAAEQNLFMAGEPVSIKSTITATTDQGKQVELGTNERVFLKELTPKMKTFKVGGKYSSRNITAPVYDIIAIDKEGNVVKFFALDKAVTAQFIPANYDTKAKGYIMADGSVFKYADKKALEQLGLTDIYHSYMVSSHKVQGQTFNHSFVAEGNIRKYVGMNDGKGGMILTPKSYAQIVYTAVSRAREKVYILSDKVSAEEGNFVDAVVKPVVLKSVPTSTTPVIEMSLSQYDLKNQCN